ncbi:MAG: GH15 family glucan-1,4-alpha-glucosidase [Cryomorphaceae bacterium]|jgi:GH15 family glucan-1,4-alpha-glucosidase
MNKHTYDFGLIGNCSFLALIGKDTNFEWMCLPRFDSSFVFGSLIAGEKKGGEFSVKPCSADYSSDHKYIENTNVLCTTISEGEHEYQVTDFAPRFMQLDRYYRPRMVIRKIEPTRGNPRVKVMCKPKGNYGENDLEVETGSNHIRYGGLEENLRLTTNIPLSYIAEEKEFVLRETYYMILTYGVPLEGPIRETAESFLNKTITYWQRWVKSTSIGNLYQSQVIRSALTLKICQYEDTGAIIAAPTSSLPESPGSTRNWDYRFCWMRDTYYTLQAFNSVGHFEEMEKYFSFISNLPVPDGNRIQPLYSITGESKLTEIEHDLPGYKGNVPVRSGNDAYTHIQNDVYGQILMAVLPLYVDNRFTDHEGAQSLDLVATLLKKIDATIDETDAGIWEFRNRSQRHAYSNLFQWAGSKAAALVAKRLGNEQLEKKAEALAKRAKDHIESTYLEEHKAYGAAQEFGYMDASTLQLIIMGYIPHDSDAAKNHLIALEKELKVNDGLFYRYRVKDDFGEPDSTFLICGFWYAEALACVGRVDDARKAFEELITYSNSLGLMSEDVDSKDGSMWGNFPQAYSHVGLINAAARINNRLDKPGFLS